MPIGSPVALADAPPTLAIHVGVVVGVGALEEVRRIHTLAVVAVVATERLGPAPVLEEERDSMSAVTRSIEVEHAVPVRARPRPPWPAR